MGRLFLACTLLLLASHASASPGRAPRTPLPATAKAALKAADIPASALHVWISPVDTDEPVLSHNASDDVNPASTMKLVTTYAGLLRLGPQFTWKTQVTARGRLHDRTLHGAVVIRGGGDPKLVVERLEPLVRAWREAGIDRIEGDIILDRRAFALPAADPSDFDGEPLRPYNTTPDALLINFKSLVMTFTPDAASGVARVKVEPPMAGLAIDPTVPLSSGPCGDWRSSLRASIANPARLQFDGHYPASCAEREWPTAYADPGSHPMRAVAGMWQRLGGALSGQVRDWRAADASLDSSPVVFAKTFESLVLADIIRDINKYSNNVMAQHLLLTLGLHGDAERAKVDTFAAGRNTVLAWWKETLPQQPAPILDNGSGLSRRERIHTEALARLLIHAARSPVAGVFMDSLPIAGQDAALARRVNLPVGQARLKTGTLKDVSALAGYVRSQSGQEFVLVAIINHEQASRGRPALDALVNWVASDLPRTTEPVRATRRTSPRLSGGTSHQSQ